MSSWKDKVIVAPDCSLRHKQSRTKGFMQETDIYEYDIVDARGEVVGTVVVTDHTAVRGFRRTIRLQQRDKSGATIVDEHWSE